MKTSLLMAAAVVAGMTGSALAGDIVSGGKTGFYYAAAEVLAGQLDFPFSYTVKESGGTPDNIAAVLADPKTIGFAQGDVLANMLATQPDLANKISVVPLTGLNECVFIAVKAKKPMNLGTLGSYGDQVTFYEPKGSGSLATLKILQDLQPDGLGLAKVVEVGSTDEAIQTALNSEGGAVLFTQFPDPDNSRFKAVTDNGGQFVTVASKAMEKLKIGNTTVYSVIPTSVVGSTTIVSAGKAPKIGNAKLSTACAQMALVTGNPATSTYNKQQDLLDTLTAIDPQSLVPSKGLFASFLSVVKTMKALSVTQAQSLYEQAQTVLN